MSGSLARLVDAAQSLRRRTFIRFLVVGGLNTAAGYGFFLAALAIMPTTFSALVASYALAVLFNFVTTGRLVFESRDWRRLFPFLAVYALVFVYQAVGLRWLEGAGMSPALAGLCLLPGGVALSYVAGRRVFRRRP